MELVIFGPHGFHSQGLIHTIIRVQDPCQTTAQTFKLFFDSSKGQSPEKTRKVFRDLLANGIAPMPMMMHHDDQPLLSKRGLAGLLNQIRYLKRAGAVSVQITFQTPMVRSKGYERSFEEGQVMRRVGGMDVADYQFDGNHTIASRSRHPWRKQFNVLVAYASFYNPFRALKAVLTIDPLWKFRIMYQVLGNLGLVRSAWASRGWLGRLKWGRIEKASAAPGPKYQLVSFAPPLFEATIPVCEQLHREVPWMTHGTPLRSRPADRDIPQSRGGASSGDTILNFSELGMVSPELSRTRKSGPTGNTNIDLNHRATPRLYY